MIQGPVDVPARTEAPWLTVGAEERLTTVDRVTGMVPPEDATMTNGAEERVTVPELKDVALDRLTTVDRVTGIVPPDDATMTRGAEDKVTVPELRAAAEDRVTVPLDSDVGLDRVTIPELKAGMLESVMVPDEILAKTPPLEVTGATAVDAPSPSTNACRCWDEETMKLSMFCPEDPGAGGT